MPESAPEDHLKITCIGDGAVGKTCMLISFIENRFPEEYVPTVFENYTLTRTCGNGKSYSMELWDTAGQEDLEAIRKLSYPDTSVLIMMYSVSSRTSYENIKTKWKVEAEENAPGVPIVLVATKSDLRGDEEAIKKLEEDADFQGIISKSEGEQLAKDIGAAGFAECSARTQEGLSSAFDTCIEVFEKKKSGGNSGSSGNKEKEGGGGCCIVM